MRSARDRDAAARGAATLLVVLATVAGLPPALGASPPTEFEVPAWAFPGDTPAAGAPGPDDQALQHVPNSRLEFTNSQVRDLFAAPDWHPDAHPPMPEIVAHGRRPTVFACGYCHLPDGRGRPENAALAGLPARYIIDQVVAFRSGNRRSPWHGPSLPMDLMLSVARLATDPEIAVAAEYFANVPMTRRVKVVEASNVPTSHAAGWLYVLDGGNRTEPLGERIIEVAVDHARHELRDAAAGFRAYVPRGSVARGAALARHGAGGAGTACSACHGLDLRGSGGAPPIAGRSPTYIIRQLLAFKTGARAGPVSALMRPAVAPLAGGEMIALAAYVATLAP